MGHLKRPIIWSGFAFHCRRCGKRSRIALQTLHEFNAVAAALAPDAGPTVDETAREFEYCTECSHGEKLPGQYFEDIAEG